MSVFDCKDYALHFPIGSLAIGQAVGPIQPGGQGGAGRQEGAGPGGQQTCHWG